MTACYTALPGTNNTFSEVLHIVELGEVQQTLKLINSPYEGFMCGAVILSNYTARMKQLSLASSTGLHGLLLALEKCPCVNYNISMETEIQRSKLRCGADLVLNGTTVA